MSAMSELHAQQQDEYDDMSEYLAWYEEQKRIDEQANRVQENHHG